MSNTGSVASIALDLTKTLEEDDPELYDIIQKEKVINK